MLTVEHDFDLPQRELARFGSAILQPENVKSRIPQPCAVEKPRAWTNDRMSPCTLRWQSVHPEGGPGAIGYCPAFARNLGRQLGRLVHPIVKRKKAVSSNIIDAQ